MKYTGIILAGGKSSRMGEDKGLLLFKNKPMIEYLINVLKQTDIPTIIIANNPEYEKFNLPVYSDIVKDKGPAGGIYTALSHSTSENNIILSCDTPFVSEELISFLIDSHSEHQITIPVYDEKIHPLIGIYNKSLLKIFKKAIGDKNLKMRNIIHSTNLNLIKVPDRIAENGKCFININNHNDLTCAKNED